MMQRIKVGFCVRLVCCGCALALGLLAAACSSSGGSDKGPDGGNPEDASELEDAEADDAESTPESGATDAAAEAGAEAGVDASAPCDPSAAPAIPALKLETVVSGIARLVYAAQPPASSDWWLVRQTGQVLIRAGGQTTMLLDLHQELLGGSATDVGDNEERGLLGLAFAPDFASSGTFYLKLTPLAGADASRDQLRQYKKTGATATLTATLLNFPASAGNHNGGQILVGPDGMLYVGAGDGGEGCNTGSTQGFPQLVDGTPNAWFGKILRLDPSNTAGAYGAAGNPFPEAPTVLHLGLRNPFRFGFDSATGDLFIGDVGQDSYEEISYAKASAKGLNFGWAKFEGKTSTCGDRPMRAGDVHAEPIFVADRRKNGCQGMYCDWISVIGGVVYRGSAIPQLKGLYVYGDYKGILMAALRQCAGGTSPVTPIRKNVDTNDPTAASFGADDFDSLVGIVEDNAKELYFVVNRNSLRKVVPGP